MARKNKQKSLTIGQILAPGQNLTKMLENIKGNKTKKKSVRGRIKRSRERRLWQKEEKSYFL